MMGSSQKRTNTFQLIAKWLIPLAISALSIYLVARQVNFSDLARAFKSVSFESLIISTVLFFAGLILRGFAWQRMLGKQFDYKATFFALSAGYLLNNVLPFRLGEFGRAALLAGNGKNKAPFLHVFGSIITERTFDVFIASIFFLSTLSLVVKDGSLRNLALLMLVLTTGILILGAILAKRETKVLNWIRRRKTGKPENMDKLAHRVSGFLQAFKILLRPLDFLISFGLLLLSWLTAMLQLWVMQKPIIPGGKLWWTGFVTSAGAFLNALPSAPAGIGVFEAGVVGAYQLLGVPQSISLAFALILHAITFVFTCVLGMVGLSILGENLNSLFRKARQTKSSEEDPS